MKTRYILFTIVVLAVLTAAVPVLAEPPYYDENKPGWNDTIFITNPEEPSKRLILAYLPSAFGLEKGDGYVDLRQARVFIPSSGGKKRRATENHIDFEYGFSDKFSVNAAKRFSTLSGSTSVIKLESTSFGIRYKFKSEIDPDSTGYHRDLSAYSCGFHFDEITADPFVIDDVPILLHDARTWGLFVSHSRMYRDHEEIHYILGYAHNKMAAGRGQCIYAGIGYLNDPEDCKFRWGGSAKLFKDFAGWHQTLIAQGIYNIHDGLNIELELGATIRGTPMTSMYFSDAAAISMNFSRESSFQNVKNRSFPYVVLALTYNF